MKKILVAIIAWYQKWLSPLKGKNTCMFTPTCSEYTKQAIIKYGVFKGGYLGIRRVLRCHPYQKNWGDDPVP